jgi:hypothetical protein
MVQIGKFTFQANPSYPDTGLIHRDIIFDTARHHAGTAVNTARSIE